MSHSIEFYMSNAYFLRSPPPGFQEGVQLNGASGIPSGSRGGPMLDHASPNFPPPQGGGDQIWVAPYTEAKRFSLIHSTYIGPILGNISVFIPLTHIPNPYTCYRLMRRFLWCTAHMSPHVPFLLYFGVLGSCCQKWPKTPQKKL